MDSVQGKHSWPHAIHGSVQVLYKKYINLIANEHGCEENLPHRFFLNILSEQPSCLSLRSMLNMSIMSNMRTSQYLKE